MFAFFYYNGFCSSCTSCTSSSACVLRLLSALSPSLDGTSLSRFLLLCFYDSFKSPEGEPSGLCLHALWLCPCLCSLVSCPLLLLTAELSFFVLDVLFCFFFLLVAALMEPPKGALLSKIRKSSFGTKRVVTLTRVKGFLELKN